MWRLGLALDVVVVLVFVAIGRSAHDHGVSLSGMASTTWPFAVGLGVAWLVMRASRRSGLRWREGVANAVVTVTLGMVLRVVAGQGTAFAFIVVALCFVGGLMLAWRVVFARARSLRRD